MSKIPKPTIYDVAHKAGVSIATVSRVLNASSQVRDVTRQKVLAAIDELGFVPKADAVARARTAVGRIGILSPFFTIPSFAQRMRGVASVLANSTYELVIYTIDSRSRYESFLAKLPFSQQLDGLIINALLLDDGTAHRLNENALETILVETTHPRFCSVQVDDERGGALAAQHLLARGHRHLGYLYYGALPNYAMDTGSARLRGYQHELEAAGITLPQHHIKLTPMNNLAETRRQIEDLLNTPQPPTAVFAAADYLALSLLRIAQERGLKVPDDLAVIGFDDIEVADLMGLTTISQSLDESGHVAARLLLSRLANPDEPLQNITIQLEVVERDTA